MYQICIFLILIIISKIYLNLNIDIGNVDGNNYRKINDKTTAIEENDENIEEQTVREDDMVEEETSEINSMLL